MRRLMIVTRRLFLLVGALLLTTTASTAVLAADQEVDDSNKIFLAGIFDTRNFVWGEDIFNYTISYIHDYLNIFPADGTTSIDWTVADSKCDATTAIRSYWDIRSSRPINGVIGCRCSGASTSVARIAGLESVPQISMSSTSEKLSDDVEFPCFSRLVSPDNANGQVGALVATMTLFGWNRVTIIATDTPYAKGLETSFRSLWKGEVKWSDTVRLNEDESVNEDSARQVLDKIPTDDPTVNSRIIMLIAHDQDAYPILKIATGTGFQPDSVWVGSQAWIGRHVDDTSWMPPLPGYIGVTLYRNRNEDYPNYLRWVQDQQRMQGKEVRTDLPDYAAEYTVDSILSMAYALSGTPPERRRDGDFVTSRIRALDFDGVSGRVQFTPAGDRADPQFTIFNKQKVGENYNWFPVGSTGTSSHGDLGVSRQQWLGRV